MDDPQDRTVFERARDGEPVLDELLSEHLPRLRAFVRAHLNPELRLRESSSDVVQSICRSLLAERSRFDFRGEGQFRGWLFAAALNKIREKHRFHHRAKRDVRREARPDGSGAEEMLWQGYGTLCTPSRAAVAEEQIKRLEAALDRLRPEHRDAVALARLAGLPLAEVAVVMGRSVDATRMLLGRALIKLEAEFKESGIGPAEDD